MGHSIRLFVPLKSFYILVAFHLFLTYGLLDTSQNAFNLTANLVFFFAELLNQCINAGVWSNQMHPSIVPRLFKVLCSWYIYIFIYTVVYRPNFRWE